uniref:Uncharacterized protein n=1 Tax=Rhizophora mucronata TaxID=61149 RepID=A0A2P2LKL7_RHIMU
MCNHAPVHKACDIYQHWAGSLPPMSKGHKVLPILACRRLLIFRPYCHTPNCQNFPNFQGERKRVPYR